tara:strand:+ start:215 stop:784 length:570 start_codon:yes stop_codon:yes gene_type:complete
MEAEQILTQFEKYCNILKKVIGTPGAERLAETLGERLAMSPRGLTEDTGGSPGGLIDFSLKVATEAKSLSASFGSTKSLVKVALLHELGRVGGLESTADLYLIQDSDWHRDKLGQTYKYNDACPKMNTSHRTLWLLSYLGIDLSREEWLAINVGQGMHLPENQFYANALNPIAAGLLAARLIVLHRNDT